MAPVVCLPVLEMSRRPDLQKNAWADMEDIGTPSPWTDYPADLKVWPDTPTPLAAQALPLPLPMLHQLPVTHNQPSEVPTSLPLRAAEAGTVGFPGEYCTQATQLPGQAFPGFETDPTLHNVAESMVVHQSCAWGYEFNDWNGAQVAPSFTWPSFSLPQQNTATEMPQPCGQWQMNNIEETSTSADSDGPASPRTDPTTGPQSKKLAEHGSGLCRPCAWYWRPQGCKNGSSCGYCHLCPEGELKSRKKNKIAAMKMGALEPVSKKASSQAPSSWGLKLDALLKE